jgi:hypothetical protein
LIQLSESDKQLTPSDDDNDKSTDESAAEE